MDIHKPKPWHGLREFLKEYVIIVVGVLTALGAEQTVEWLHERAQLAEARDALRAEIAKNTGAEANALQEDRCYLKVLDLYDAWAKGGSKPDVPGLAIPYPRATVWDTAKNGAVTHMDQKERLSFAEIYDQTANLEALQFQQRDMGLAIRGYLSLDHLTPAEGRDMIRAVGGYRTLLRGKANQEGRYIRMARALGIPARSIPAEELPFLEKLCALVGVKPESMPQTGPSLSASPPS